MSFYYRSVDPLQAFIRLRRQIGILVISTINLLAYAGLVRMDLVHGTLRGAYTPQSIAWYLLAFFTYAAALVWVERQGISTRWLWGVAILARVMLLVTAPTLSDDVYRMLWDGYVANEGISPYAHAIDSPALDYLEVPVRGLANNTWMASPYLPAAQGVFFGLTALFPLRPVVLQGAMVIFDLLSAVIIARLLTLAFLPGKRLLIYLWNPLVIVEVAHGAHIDAWMVFLSLLAVYWSLRSALPALKSVERSQYFRVFLQSLPPLFLALATLTKLLPVLLLPVLYWLWNWPQRIFYGLATLLILVPFGLSAGWGLRGELNGTGVFGAFRIYAYQWNFNSGIFHWLEIWLGKQGMNNPVFASKVIVILLLLFLATAVWLTARNRTQPLPALRLMSLPLMGYVLLTPTFHPWYLLFLLAFLPYHSPADGESRWRWLGVAPWIYLSGALAFSYLTYLNPLQFGELEWVRIVEWLPVLVLLAIAIPILLAHRKTAYKSITTP